jgi:hypothetical protein
VAIFTIVSILLVGITVATVNAEPSNRPTRAANEPLATAPDALREAAFSITAIEPPRCDPRQDVDRYVRCLNRYLTRLANGVNQALGTFDDFFRCTSYLPITQYGDPTGATEGYVYDPGTGVTFKTTALDVTVDTATDPFSFAYVLKNTVPCFQFAQ